VRARHHRQEALTRYDAIGAPEASEIRTRLAAPDDGGDGGSEPAEEGRIAVPPPSPLADLPGWRALPGQE
jgi:hypothetical protein